MSDASGFVKHPIWKRLTFRSLGQSMEGSKPQKFAQQRSATDIEKIAVEPFACCTRTHPSQMARDFCALQGKKR